MLHQESITSPLGVDKNQNMRVLDNRKNLTKC